MQYARHNMLPAILLIVLVTIVLIPWDVTAQCPMCKAGAESALEAGDNTPRGLNSAIMYLFATPYLLVGSIGFWWWYKNRKKANIS